jgi:hypothetical protein
LLRRQERATWLNEGAEEWQPPDPDELRDELHVYGFQTGTSFDAAWHHILQADPLEQEKTRRRQILQLARYGRFGGSSPCAWDDEPVTELRAWWRTLKEILDEEDSLSRASENR